MCTYLGEIIIKFEMQLEQFNIVFLGGDTIQMQVLKPYNLF